MALHAAEADAVVVVVVVVVVEVGEAGVVEAEGEVSKHDIHRATFWEKQAQSRKS